MTFSDKLHLLMTQRGFNAEYVAMRVEIAPSYVSKLLSGARDNPSEDVILRMSQLFGVAPAYLDDTLDGGQWCDTCRTILERDGTRWWCPRCHRHTIPLGYKHGIDGLMAAERAYQRSISIPGSGSRSSKRHGTKKPNKRPDPTTNF